MNLNNIYNRHLKITLKNINLFFLFFFFFFYSLGCNSNKVSKEEATQDLPSDISASTSAPLPVTITSPKFNPLTTNASTISLSGKCNTDTLVSLQGDSQQFSRCTNSTYTFDIEKVTDGTYTFQLFQRDSFGNISEAKEFSWVKSETLPPPVITSPASSPFYGTSKILNVQGTCLPGKKISMSGGATQSTICNLEGEFSMGVATLIDMTWTLNLVQKDLDTNVESAAQTLIWTYDSIAPIAPILTTPASNPYTSNDSSLSITVACENNASVVAECGSYTETQTCTGNTATFTDNTQVTAGTYSYSIVQTDLAGHPSPALELNWIKTP